MVPFLTSRYAVLGRWRPRGLTMGQGLLYAKARRESVYIELGLGLLFE